MTANVSDLADNAALTVRACGSVALGITATPVDAEHRLSVTITGVPRYETITAPSGDSVTSSRQSNGTYRWTITESAAAAGTPLTGLTLHSSYTGSGHPVATLNVTASDSTSNETGTSASRSITVTDPPAATSATAPNSLAPNTDTLAAASPASARQLAMLFDQLMAAFFQDDPCRSGSDGHVASPVGRPRRSGVPRRAHHTA